jgi:hypothetical protein
VNRGDIVRAAHAEQRRKRCAAAYSARRLAACAARIPITARDRARGDKGHYHDEPKNRLAAIETLTRLADRNNKDTIIEAIRGQRYNPDADVRKAVEVAAVLLESGRKP